MPIKKNCDVLYLLGRHSTEQYEVFKKFQTTAQSLGLDVRFVAFLKEESEKIGDKISYFSSAESSLDSDVESEAKRLEAEYEFTFQHITYPEQVQLQRSRTLDEQQANDIQNELMDYIYLEDLVKQLQPELILRGQGAISTNYFADRLAETLEIPQATFAYEFLNRMVFFKKLTGKETQMYDINFNPEISRTDTKEYIRQYMNSGTLSTPIENSSNQTWKNNFLKLFKNPKKIKKIPQWIKTKTRRHWLRGDIYAPNVFKDKMYDDPTYTDEYFFLPFHLPIESTNVYRGHPYVNQVSLTEYISRNLPYDTKLYVREHPNWPGYFGPSFIRSLAKIPNVRIISPKIDVHKVLNHSRGVVVLNNTTGYEALMHHKPVVALSSSPFASHNSAFHVKNPYEINKHLIRAYNHNVEEDLVLDFLTRMFKSSVDITLKTQEISDQSQIDTIGKRFGEVVHEIVEKTNC
jgi:hypothetical protein